MTDLSAMQALLDVEAMQALLDVEEGDPTALIGHIHDCNLAPEEKKFLEKFIKKHWKLPRGARRYVTLNDEWRISQYVMAREANGHATKNAVAAAGRQFGVGRSTVFAALRKWREKPGYYVQLLREDAAFRRGYSQIISESSARVTRRSPPRRSAGQDSQAKAGRK